MDLLPIEEIYRTAGIVSPQMGYSVHKVIDMLRSKHMRGLDRELKRSAILMALDAAGVSLGQLEADARSRQEALNRYEAEQRKHVEVEWARRAQETAQIQAELERVKSYHMTRISRNLEGIAREKSAFNAWLEGKKREIEETGEVLGLLMSSPSEKASGPPLAKAAAASAGRGGAKAVRRA
jgi:chromosome segregation ATPase